MRNHDTGERAYRLTPQMLIALEAMAASPVKAAPVGRRAVCEALLSRGFIRGIHGSDKYTPGELWALTERGAAAARIERRQRERKK